MSTNEIDKMIAEELAKAGSQIGEALKNPPTSAEIPWGSKAVASAVLEEEVQRELESDFMTLSDEELDDEVDDLFDSLKES